MKNIDTLIDDIHAIFDKENHKVNPDNLQSFADNIAAIVKKRLEYHEATSDEERAEIRASRLGVKDRKFWFETHYKDNEEYAEAMRPDGRLSIMFMFGDIIEELLLLLVKEAGHKVEGEQGEVDIDGVKGHRDCKIDGITVDIKSTSKYSFQKFSKGTLFQDDPFGYVAQLSAYSKADDSPFGAFLAMNKETAELALLKLHPIDMINPYQRVQRLREVVEMPAPPAEKCFDPVPYLKSGNKMLHRNCTYCVFKEKCWEDANGGVGLRSFQYSDGVKYFVEVVKEPRVEQVSLSNNSMEKE